MVDPRRPRNRRPISHIGLLVAVIIIAFAAWTTANIVDRRWQAESEHATQLTEALAERTQAAEEARNLELQTAAALWIAGFQSDGPLAEITVDRDPAYRVAVERYNQANARVKKLEGISR